jgi:type VI secretion system protein ImpE
VPADPTVLLKSGDLAGALAALQDRVRARPSDAPLRIFLFQLLCVTGEWKRAVTQLKLCAELDAAAIPMAQTYREAIVCEVFRERVFAGDKAPLILGEPGEWVALMVQALHALAAGQASRAADLRARAFDMAPAAAGTADGARFDWIADADMRLGPLLEVIVAGKYYWLPFADVARLTLDPPADLRDAVWTPCTLALRNGGEMVALIPTRYPGTATTGDDAARLSRATTWADAGGGTWVGTGQRQLATDAGDLPLMELRHLAFDGPADG